VTSKIAEVTARCRKIGALASRSFAAFPRSGHQARQISSLYPLARVHLDYET